MSIIWRNFDFEGFKESQKTKILFDKQFQFKKKLSSHFYCLPGGCGGRIPGGGIIPIGGGPPIIPVKNVIQLRSSKKKK